MNEVFLLKIQSYLCSEQSSDFFHQLYSYSKDTLRDPTIYIYLESVRRDLQNDEIYKMSRFTKFLRI